MGNVLYVVVPCYNEQEVLPETAGRLLEKLKNLMAENKIDRRSRILFVNDGSKDATWSMIQSFAAANPVYAGVNLSRNRGHQNALLAGITTAAEHADMIVSMDADLQDDINAMDAMTMRMRRGMTWFTACVLPDRRIHRLSGSRPQAFYRMMRLMGAEIVFDHADYRLLSRRAAQALLVLMR